MYKIGKLGMASDHAGVEYKAALAAWLKKCGVREIKDFGTFSSESMDYPDVAHPLASAVEKGEVELGIALCGTGNGMAITLNKHAGVRAGLAWDTEVGRLVKAHNNANILVLPARFVSYRKAQNIIKAWLESDVEGGRHQRRIDKIPVK